MALALTDRIAVRPDVIYRPVGEEAIVLDLEGGTYFGLDAVGSRIWALAEHADLDGISRQLTEEYHVSIDDARRDVMAFVQSLIDRGLVSCVAPTD